MSCRVSFTESKHVNVTFVSCELETLMQSRENVYSASMRISSLWRILNLSSTVDRIYVDCTWNFVVMA